MASRRRRFSRARRVGGRFKRGARRHPKLTTRLANGIGLLIAFNQEIGSAVQSGPLWQSSPQQALNGILYNSTGYNSGNGVMDFNQLAKSAGSKIGGYAFARIVKALMKRLPVM